MSEQLTAATLIALVERCPVEARPKRFKELTDVCNGADGDEYLEFLEQACIGALVQWLDAWCVKFSNVRGSGVRLGDAPYWDAVYSTGAFESSPRLWTAGPTRLESLVALVEQLNVREAAR